MVTGDNKDTARAIAKDCQIIMNDDDIVMEGPEFIERTGGVVCKRCQTFKCDCEYDKATAKKRGVSVRIDTI
jgi:P-type Ca2+ transporter type 2B